MSFLETPRFPDKLAFTTSIGPRTQTTRIATLSGNSFRNQEWPSHLWRFDIVPALRKHPQFQDEVIDYYIAVAGGANGFRIKNRLDYKSCPVGDTPTKDDQLLGTGDGVEDEFQIVKNVTRGTLTTVKKILKIVSGTLLVAVDGVLQTETTDYTVDYNTGLITFEAGSIPASTLEVTAGYEYDSPVVFENDDLSVVVENKAGPDLLLAMSSIPLIELRNPG